MLKKRSKKALKMLVCQFLGARTAVCISIKKANKQDKNELIKKLKCKNIGFHVN